MTSTILSIDHDVIKFRIAPEPDDFKKQGLQLLGTVLRRHMPESKETIIYGNQNAIKYVVGLTAKQVLNREKDLLELSLKSTFIFSKTQEDPKDDFWCGLILKAIEGLNYSYGLKTKDTYLKNIKLAFTDTMKEDCLKQRNVQRMSRSN